MNKKFVSKLFALMISIYLPNVGAASLTLQLPNGSNIDSTTVGSEFDVKVMLDGVNDFGGFDFALTFKKAYLSAQSITTGNVFGADTVSLLSEIDPVGTVHFAEALVDTATTPGVQVNAPTLLATIHFKALDVVKDSVLGFVADPILSNFAGDALAFTATGALVTVTAAPVPLPSAIFMFIPGLMLVIARNKRVIA